MSCQIIFATGNEGKMKEIRAILADLGLPIRSMKEAGIHTDIVEDGTTFLENARIKTRAVATACREAGIGDAIVLADDSGLVVDAMNGEPGIYSARWMGEETSYQVKNQAVIDRLKGVSGADRAARFVCEIAAVFPDGSEADARGTYEGVIAEAPAGCGGFGYDPILYLPDRGCTSAELPAEEKNAISHRGKALEQIKPQIQAWLRDHAGE